MRDDLMPDGFNGEINYNDDGTINLNGNILEEDLRVCLLYTSPSPRDATLSRMPSSA